MTRETTYTLYVNLSASQTRKRLKGHGFGVRQVEATDRKQCAITHTATGDHCRDLQALFSDVEHSQAKAELDALRANRASPSQHAEDAAKPDSGRQD